MKRKRLHGGFNPLRLLILILVPLGIASQLAFRQYVRVGHTRHPVVTSAVKLAPGMQIGAAHVQVVQMQEKNIPEGALARTSDVIGRQVVQGKSEGEPILRDDITSSGLVQGLSQAIPEGRVLTSLTLQNINVPYRDLRRGDRVDILAAGISTDRTPTAYVVARDVIVIGYTLPPKSERSTENILGVDLDLPDAFGGASTPSAALLVALNPRDVIPVTQVVGTSTVRISFVLHSAENVRKGKLPDVQLVAAPRRFAVVEVIRGAKMEEVRF